MTLESPVPQPPSQQDLGAIAAQVQQRAEVLLRDEAREPLDVEFVKQCLDANERGDGCLFATLHRGRFIFNTTPKDGEWYCWDGHAWQPDTERRSLAAVEDCALEYQRQAQALDRDIEIDGVDKNHRDAWKIKLRDKYLSRVNRLRSAAGAAKVLHWAPVVEPAMFCREDEFDNKPWLLPVKNGVIDLKTGALVAGRPEDLLTIRLDIEYDPHADYAEWAKLIEEISNDTEVAAFVKRSLGYAITGHSHEQHIWVFTGPGRNGKGVMFDLVGDVMRPFFHVIKRAMILEQRFDPSPSAASEHLYSLRGKRIILGAETNKGQKIDASAVKTLTGDDDINCRPNFKGEITFKPSHTLFLHTNHLPIGLAKEFSLVQRLIMVVFPWIYVDDIEAEKKKRPAWADRFRKKDSGLKARLRENKAGILRWLVEGCREWQLLGLAPPKSIISGVDALAREEDFVGQFMDDCLVHYPNDDRIRISCTSMYSAFKWWWSQNMDSREQKTPAMKTINEAIRARGYLVEAVGGKTWIYRFAVNQLNSPLN